MNPQIAKAFIIITVLISACTTNSRMDALSKIEESLKIEKNADESDEARLGAVIDRIEKLTNYKQAVIVNNTSDTIERGKVNYILLSHHIYENGYQGKAVLRHKGKEKVSLSKNGIYEFKLDSLELGNHEYYGKVIFEKDTLEFLSSFYVK